MTNNHSERALRAIAVGRKNWLFFLVELVHVMPLWPRDRYLELCPRDWAATRARLDPVELERELGPITVPPRLSGSE